MTDLSKIIGKTFMTVTLDDSKDIITFVTGNSSDNIRFEAIGDCCSSSWIEHMDDVPTDFTVTNVIEKDTDREDDAEGDCLQKYFYEVVTDKGSFTIEMRNSSNGYYGGYLQCV